MKLFKSLLLASATGLVAVSGASAADLGAKKPSPVEYVRACYNPLWGTSGGFVIPGTQTCVRVFGQARFDYGYVEPAFRTAAPSGFRGGAIVGLDAITPSEFGNVRAFAQVGLVYRSGNQRTGTGTRQGTFIDGAFGSGIPGGGSGGGTEVVFSGFIQFAGITAGRTASFFDPFFTPEVIGTTFRSSPGNVNLIAYTAALGNGFTATISVEDPTVRRQAVVAQGFVPALGIPVATATGLQGGIAVPHIVGALQLDQAWGSVKVAGVLTNVRPAFTVGNAAGANFFTGAPGPAFASIPSTKYGFAVQGALKINLPMIAAGDNFVITGAYGEGALSYVTSNYFAGASAGQGILGGGYTTGDGVVNTVGNFRLIKAWSVAAGFQHFWAPTLSSTIFGSYAQIDVPGTTPLNVTDTVRDGSYWAVGVNTIWQPVRGLNIAAEVAYSHVDPSGRIYDFNRNANFAGVTQCAVALVNQCFTKSSDGQIQARLRITRDF
jgi:hypothetical protein